MQEILIQKPEALNAEALEEALRGTLGPALRGISSGPYGLRIHLAGPLTEAQIAQARAIVQSHDPAQLTARQSAALERRHRLEQARAANSAPLNPQAYSGEAALIRQLAHKIAWLEQEIDALRAGEG